LTRARFEGGVAPETDLGQAQTVLATAQADVASLRTALAQDANALQLLLGSPVDPALMPASIEDVSRGLKTLPAGLASTVLLRRPDVLQAEYQLRAANAQIGAARAALFPTISLTGALGLASTALSSLFTHGALASTIAPSISFPIFNAGAGRAGVAFSRPSATRPWPLTRRRSRPASGRPPTPWRGRAPSPTNSPPGARKPPRRRPSTD
jgi:multidrug efflux system outer membrane protein